MKGIALLFCIFCSSLNAADLSKYDHLDPQKIVPTKPFIQALDYLETNSDIIKNKNFLTIIDYTQVSTKKRMYIIDLTSGRVDRYLVAHGKNSDPNYTGRASEFGDELNSLKTAPGFYLSLDEYIGKHGLSLRLKGLSETNKNALERAIVLHSANYVNEDDLRVGRSWGCPVVDPKHIRKVVDQLKSNSLIYLWVGQ